MRIKLARKWIDLLLRIPESGMGYQRVDVRFVDGRVLRDVLVFNAEDLEVPDDCAGLEIKEIQVRK